MIFRVHYKITRMSSGGARKDSVISRGSLWDSFGSSPRPTATEKIQGKKKSTAKFHGGKFSGRSQMNCSPSVLLPASGSLILFSCFLLFSLTQHADLRSLPSIASITSGGGGGGRYKIIRINGGENNSGFEEGGGKVGQVLTVPK